MIPKRRTHFTPSIKKSRITYPFILSMAPHHTTTHTMDISSLTTETKKRAEAPLMLRKCHGLFEPVNRVSLFEWRWQWLRNPIPVLPNPLVYDAGSIGFPLAIVNRIGIGNQRQNALWVSLDKLRPICLERGKGRKDNFFGFPVPVDYDVDSIGDFPRFTVRCIMESAPCGTLLCIFTHCHCLRPLR